VAAMTFSWDLNTATLLALLTNLVMLVVFAVRTHGKATSAVERATEAQKTADEAHVAIGVLSSSLAMFREHVAEKYVDKNSLREMEDRLTRAIEKVGERVDGALHRK
jgi:type II secretory pathway component PulK